MNTGRKPSPAGPGLITTIAWDVDGKTTYALEGSVFVTGAVIQWLRDEIGLIENAAESETFAAQVEDAGGVYVVPAFTGLGAPYWDMYARGTIVGLTRGTNKFHLVRAALESLAYQVKDVIDFMTAEASIGLKNLKVDGGASINNFLMQFQADILGAPVARPHIVETTARGAAFLAGLTTGVWKDLDELARKNRIDRTFIPKLDNEVRNKLFRGWKKAVERARGWEEEQE